MKVGYKPVKTNRFGTGKKYHSHDGYRSHLISQTHGVRLGIFEKGQFPWNKGMKGIMKVNSGSFTSERMAGINHPMWRGGHKYYRGVGWSSLAKNVIKEERECADCNRREKLQVHHLIPFRYWVDSVLANQRGNLVPLCPSHHMKADWQWQKNGKGEIESILGNTLLDKSLAITI